MKIDFMGLIGVAGRQLGHTDSLRAYVLCEFANNLRLVLRGEKTLEDFKAVYGGQDGEPLDLDKLFPVSP
jgi:hypothetical protein